MYHITSEASFDAAHFLKNHPSKCRNLHGHRWKVVVEVSSNELNEEAMVLDFSDLKKVLRELVDQFDHSFIYEKGSLKIKTYEALKEEGFKLNEVSFRPTAECFAYYFYQQLSTQFPVTKVDVYETPTNKASYEVTL